jgi:hypothetical protein
MANSPLGAIEAHPAATPSPKLRAALEYLGDKLVTHPASRFKPTQHTLLDTWLASRRRPLAQSSRDYRGWLTTADLPRIAANAR